MWRSTLTTEQAVTDVPNTVNQIDDAEDTITPDRLEMLEKEDDSFDKASINRTGVTNAELYPPDEGWRAWLCVFGAACGIFCSFGYANVIGMFVEYYESNQLREYSKSQISWITSLETCLIVFCGVIVGRVYDIFGPKILLIIGTILMTFGVMMTSICKQYYQFILAQGVCTSVGAALVFNPCISAVSTWFVKKRATALGVVNAGSSLGGVVMPLLFRNVQLRAGFGWGVRSIGFLILALSAVSCFTVTSRLSPPGRQPIKFRQTYIYPFKSTVFALSAIGICFVYWGVFIPISYIPAHAAAHGFSPSLALYLTSIQNGVSTLGRILPGLLADKFGRFNTYVLGVYVTAILTVALWIPATNQASIIAYAALFGFWSGIAVSVWQPLVAEISPMREVGARLGAVSAALSFSSLLGSPVAGAIISRNNGQYYGAATFAAVMMFAGASFCQAAKIVRSNGNWLALN